MPFGWQHPGLNSGGGRHCGPAATRRQALGLRGPPLLTDSTDDLLARRLPHCPACEGQGPLTPGDRVADSADVGAAKAARFALPVRLNRQHGGGKLLAAADSEARGRGGCAQPCKDAAGKGQQQGCLLPAAQQSAAQRDGAAAAEGWRWQLPTTATAGAACLSRHGMMASSAGRGGGGEGRGDKGAHCFMHLLTRLPSGTVPIK